MKPFDKTQGLRAVIFDMDGLLIDSEPVWYQAYGYLCKNYNLRKNQAVFVAAKGMGLREVVLLYKKRLGLEGDPSELVKEFRKIFYQVLFKDGGLKLLEGAKESLQNFRKNKLIIALATGGHTKNMAIKILEKVHVNDFFDKVMSSDEVKNGKPSPEIYLYAANNLGVEPLNCLVLEDSVNGVLAGKAAGMKVFGVNKDEKIRGVLEKTGADKVFSSLLEITI